MLNRGESLKDLRIADYYSSLLHLSGFDVTSGNNNQVFDGIGNPTGISLSALGDRVTFSHYIAPSSNEVNEWLDAFFPINSIMLTTTNDNPTKRIANTKWVQEGGGQFLVGVGGTDKRFTAGSGGLASGDRAGEYTVKLNNNTLPAHTHDVNVRTTIKGDTILTNVFCYYFGDPINPRGLTEEKLYSTNSDLLPNVSNNPYSYFLNQDEIEAFQNNTTYNGQRNYREFLIKKRHDDGYRYTDLDFDPKIASYSLAGWGGSVVNGPGWGGLISSSIPNTKIFITDSPRPVGVPWSGTSIKLEQADYDPRDSDRVHPGRLSSEDLLRARNIIIDVLGEEQAAIALEGVNRLKELDEQVNNANIFSAYANEQVKGSTTRASSNTGDTYSHNNIPPNYGLYLWRRVPLDYIEPEVPPGGGVEITPPIIDTPEGPAPDVTWRGTIVSNKKNLNLYNWARDRGWDGRSPAEITIRNNVYIFSDDSEKPALTTGNWPGGLTLINNGFIMGRGGDGGSYAAGNNSRYSWSVGRPPNRQKADGWPGGDAIKINTSSRIVINNRRGAIAGGGGGGAGSGSGNYGGGGGGAGGGKGGVGSSPDRNKSPGRRGAWEKGGDGGRVGKKGKDGGNWRNESGGISRRGGRFRNSGDKQYLQGRGGEAGGGGAGGWQQSGNDPHGGGGGGGRILKRNARGGRGGDYGGGNGGNGKSKGKNSKRSRKKSPWGNAAGGGGWGADGGDFIGNLRSSLGGRRPKGGKGGKAVDSKNNSNFTIQGGIVYGKID